MLAITGCAFDGRRAAPSPEMDIARHRAIAALQRLQPACVETASMTVSPSMQPAASCWSGGAICVSLGLLRMADDDELCAAVAHELGHIIGASDIKTEAVHALRGGSATPDVEQHADAIAVVLLRRSGVAPSALARMLAKVRDAPQTPAGLRPAMTERIALLPSN